MVSCSISAFGVEILLYTCGYLEFRLHNLRSIGSETIVCRQLNLGSVVESVSIYRIPDRGGHKIDVILGIQVYVERNKAAHSESIPHNTERDSAGVQGLDRENGGFQPVQEDYDRRDFKSLSGEGIPQARRGDLL